MNARRVLFLVTVVAAACNGERERAPQQTFTADSDGFSCELPRTWSAQRDRGSIIFTSAAEARRTIVVRAIPRGEKESATLEHATEVVLSGLPQVQILRSHAVGGSLGGTAYELTFVPPGARTRYVRTHVVLIGDEHVFHIFDTAPVAAAPHDTLVTDLIASFREEV